MEACEFKDICDEIFFIWINKPGNYMMPLLYEACIASWQIKNPNRKVVIYTDTTELKFNLLSKDTTETRLIDEYFPGLLQKADDITKETPTGMKFAHMSDYIRYVILSCSGGIYVDCDLMCLKPINGLIEECQKNNTPIIMAYEDKMRICNAFMACINEEGIDFYRDIVTNYEKRYVKSSYTYNSIKYPMLLKNKYSWLIYICPFKEGFFYPNWEQNENGDLELLKQKECPLSGWGVHLYNTDIKWKEIRDVISKQLMGYKSDWWIVEVLTDCMEKYQDLMAKSETRDIFKDKKLVEALTKLYGEEYLNQFKRKDIQAHISSSYIVKEY